MSTDEIPKIQKIVSVAWPSFLVAGVATVLFFTSFDPREFLAPTRFAGLSRLGAYSIGFFLFWLVGFASSALTCYFRRTCDDCNDDNPTD